MEIQRQISQMSSILGETLVREALSKMIQVEGEKCLRKIDKIKQELELFEKKFGMSSKKAWEKYQKGELGDDFDVMEWMSLFENQRAFQEQYERIRNSEQ